MTRRTSIAFRLIAAVMLVNWSPPRSLSWSHWDTSDTVTPLV